MLQTKRKEAISTEQTNASLTTNMFNKMKSKAIQKQSETVTNQ